MSDPAANTDAATQKGKSSNCPLSTCDENKEPSPTPVSNISSKKTPPGKTASSKSYVKNQTVVPHDNPPAFTHSCHTCKAADNSRMVQCDECDKWHHYSCVGVCDEIAYNDWMCAKFVSKSKKEKKKTTLKKGIKKIGNKTVKKSTKLRKKKEVTRVESEKKNSTKLPPPGDDQSAKPSRAESLASGVSRRSAKAALELKLMCLEAERTFIEEKNRVEMERLRVLKEMAELESEKGSQRGSKKDQADGKSKVEDWLRNKHPSTKGSGSKVTHQDEEEEVEESTDASEEVECSEEDTSEESSSESEETTDEDESEEDEKEETPKGKKKFNPLKRSTPKKGHTSKSLNARKAVTNSNQISCSLTRNQLAARHVVSKDLPSFNGNPEEWPMFISTYESTTQMCGFTDDENMVRLRNCLKGDAFAAVRSFLLHPSTVSRAVSALKLRFGQPQFVINTLKERILAMPPVKSDSMNKLIDFALSVQNLAVTIDACGRKDYMRDVSLLQDLIGKLPASMKLEWARSSRTLRKVNVKTFSEWIYSIAEDASLVSEPRAGHEKQANVEVRSSRKVKAYLNAHSETPEQSPVRERQPRREHHPSPVVTQRSRHDWTCFVCRKDCKSLEKCQRFMDLSYDAKWDAVHESKSCRRCLRKHKGGCDAKICGIHGCTFRHHALLHKDLYPGPSTSAGPKKEEQPCHTHQTTSSSVLFRYVPVVLHGNGKSISCFAFLDDGSALTLIDQELADDLNLVGEPKPLCLKWTGGTHRYEADSRSVSVDISGNQRKRFNLEGVRTVQELQLPFQTLDMDQLKKEHDYLRGIPIESYQNMRPRLLIGVKHANVTLVRKSREGKPDEPIAVKTNLGWTVYGGWAADQSMSMVHYTFHICSCDHEIDDTLQRAMKEYFSLDSMGISRPVQDSRSRDDERAIALLYSLTRFNGEQYETGLLWRQETVRLPDSKPMALRRLHSLEKRMEKDPEMARILHEKIVDYVKKGYIRKVTDEELKAHHDRVWYMPVFPVTNPNKPGKVRIVWDAAATMYDVSLNSVLLTGPDQLAPLTSVLYKFRESRFAVCGDIREMFHQVRIRSEDQHCQRFLWRDSADQKEPSTYVMEVMTFGACCSPASAQYAKNLNAERFSDQFPAATEAIVNRTYVDDMLCSVETEEEAVDLAKSVRFVHAQGGFEIRNWMSNSPAILSALSEEPATEKSLDLSSEMATEKVLGMWWCTSSDCFTFKINWARLDRELLNGRRCPTKREVLRTLMTIYDPLGLISNYLMYLKVLLQEIWRTRVQWDEQIDQKSFDKWLQWLKLLPQLEKLKIPRCYRQNTSASAARVELHTFVDASDKGMAATVYLRYVQGESVECVLVGAKTRVAPLKYLSIPRLELQAAVMGARLADSIIRGLSIKITRCIYWSDSRNVLAWLQADHRRYSQFVAARTSEISELSDVSNWRWVPTKWNVADEGTKWQRQPDFTSESRWFRGPEFLLQSEEKWPLIPCKIIATEEEIRHSVLTHVELPLPLLAAKDFSKWSRLVNATAYVYRFIGNTRSKKSERVSGVFTSDEIRRAEQHLYRQAQRDVYSQEISILRRNISVGRGIPKSSPIHRLNPCLDECGVLRMQGRTGACQFIQPDVVNPIILPAKHPITWLAFTDIHEKFHHQNYETIVNEVRQKFCVSRLRSMCNTVRYKCQRCKIRDARPHPPAMANLPACRLAAYTRPFTHTGVDYFGPIDVMVGRRVEKRWGVLLTCLTIRAVHIELASSLNTSSCIMALRNFITRRGTPAAFYSDRGTNFVGSNRELREALQAVDQDLMAKEFVSGSTAWHFNPPAAPHMGGSWERLIQSVKRNLAELRVSLRPTDEELRNALTEIEGILNTRPLTHVPIDEESAPALTPNHFLLGSSDGPKPLTLLSDSAATLRHGWHVSQVLANQFWKRWLRDYLPEITRRAKWFQKVKPIEIDDVVLIVDPDLPRNCWPKGRVIGTVNRDGQVRRVTIQTLKGVYERPAVNVAVLNVRREEELANPETE